MQTARLKSQAESPPMTHVNRRLGKLSLWVFSSNFTLSNTAFLLVGQLADDARSEFPTPSEIAGYHCRLSLRPPLNLPHNAAQHHCFRAETKDIAIVIFCLRWPKIAQCLVSLIGPIHDLNNDLCSSHKVRSVHTEMTFSAILNDRYLLFCITVDDVVSLCRTLLQSLFF